jgi:hypothetical protein
LFRLPGDRSIVHVFRKGNRSASGAVSSTDLLKEIAADGLRSLLQGPEEFAASGDEIAAPGRRLRRFVKKS